MSSVWLYFSTPILQATQKKKQSMKPQQPIAQASGVPSSRSDSATTSEVLTLVLKTYAGYSMHAAHVKSSKNL